MPRRAALVVTAAAALAAIGLSSIAGCASVLPADPPAARMTVTLAPDPSFSPVTASPSPATPLWGAAPCAAGEFTGLEADELRNTVLSASVSLCGPWATKYSFTVVAFRPSHPVAFASTAYLRPYNQVGPTPVRGGIAAAPISGELGVCLMRSQTARMACVRLTFHLSEPTTMLPIPVDDPLVSKPVILLVETPPPHPWGFCGSCLPILW
jgi:hypothetical protein